MASMTRLLAGTIGALTRRAWPEGAAEKYIGANLGAYLAHALDGSLRTNAASGGVVSAILIDLLEKGKIDGALVCRSVIRDGKVRAEFFIARNKTEILQSQGSKYVPVYFAREALPLIEKFQGDLAVVGLPCDIEFIRRRMEKETSEDSTGAKVRLLIAIVCGHNSETPLVDRVARVLERETGSKINGYRFRSGLWRGELSATFDNGMESKRSFSSRFGLYQNLYFWSEKKCFQCHDHYGYKADISSGDVWSLKLRNTPIKYSGVIARTQAGRNMFDGAVRAGAIETKPIAASLILDGQARTGPFHYNVSARVSAAKFHGLKLKDKVFEPVKWNDRISAHIALLNWRWSMSKTFGKLIFRIPRPFLKVYLYFFKFLESL